MNRERDVEGLLQFQAEHLSAGLEKLCNAEETIAALERVVALETNLVSSIRGLVGIRTSSSPDQMLSVTSKHRFWIQPSGEIDTRERQTSNCLSQAALDPNGIIYSKFCKRFEAPRQSFTGPVGAATIILSDTFINSLDEDFHFPEKGSWLWIVFWLDRNSSLWRHFVTPPRSKNGTKIGLFATRSPNRPSPIGLSLSLVEDIVKEEGKILVRGIDILDETPLLALKPYDVDREAFSNALCGWIDIRERVQPLYYDNAQTVIGSSEKPYAITFASEACNRMRILESESVVDIPLMIRESLRSRLNLASPATSKSDDQRSIEQGSLAIGAFRVLFTIDVVSRTVVVTDLVSGMRQTVCEAEAAVDPEARMHLRFKKQSC